MRVWGSALLATGVWACTTSEPVVALKAPPEPVALTATTTATLIETTCIKYAFDRAGKVGSGGDTRCTSEQLDISQASVDDPGVFDVITSQPRVVSLTARSPGVTTLRAASTAGSAAGQTFEARIEARRPTHLALDFGCDAGRTIDLAAGSEVSVGVRAFDGTQALQGAIPQPISCALLAPTFGDTTFRVSADAGRAPITAPLDPAMDLEVRVFALNEATVSVMPPTLGRFGANTASFWPTLHIDGHRACADRSVLRAETSTPDVCHLGTDDQNRPRHTVDGYSGNEVVVHGTKGASCQVRFALKDAPAIFVEHTQQF